MKPLNGSKPGNLNSQRSSVSTIKVLTTRLADAEKALHAIRTGEVDAVMVAGKQGPQVFTLEGANYAYRVLIECMNEGALTLTAAKTILYANQCFARMVKCPLEQVIGGSFRRFLSAEDRAKVRLLMQRPGKSGAKIQVTLKAGDGTLMPAQVSIRGLANGRRRRATIGMVVTDMTGAKRTEESLRALTHRVVQAQEAERARVALQLHDHITQLLCAALVRCQALANTFPVHDTSLKQKAIELRELLGQTAGEVERISRNLRPSVLDELGLAAVLRETSMEFAQRTGVRLKLACGQLTARLPADTELALYRILQEALRNIEQHARARHVSVIVKRPADYVKLVVHDDGIGFNPEVYAATHNGNGGLGLVSIRERVTAVGGDLKLKSVRRTGTEIEVRIPVAKTPARPGR